MKTSLRALFGVSGLALLLTATPVFAAQVDVTNNNTKTGADSTNDNNSDVDNDLTVTSTNTGTATNVADADVETGDNKQKENTTGGDMNSGSVDASTDWDNVINTATGFSGSSAGDLDVTADFTNDTTGADSTNKNKLTVDNDVTQTMKNTATLLNSLGLDASTGDNKQEKNTTAGDITSGDVSLDSMISNMANTGSSFAGASGGSTTLDVMAENNTTGADSTNKNTVDVTNDVTQKVTNTATLTNTVDVDAETGNNSQKKNTTAGNITTGDVDVSTDITNAANNGSSTSGASWGGLDVTVDAANDTTGADSDNTNKVTVDNTTTVTETNTATATNTLDVDASTGDNKQEKNTTAGDISTGNVKIDFNVSNQIN